MILKDIKIIRYRNIKKMNIDFSISDDERQDMSFSISDGYNSYSPMMLFSDTSNENLIEDINSFFYFLSLISNKNVIKSVIKHQFTDEITKVEMSFHYKNVNYYYMFSVSKEGFHREVLCADESVVFSTSELQPVLSLPEEISEFFSKILYVDLMRASWLNDMIITGIDYCLADDSYLHSVSVLLKKLDLTSKDLILDSKSEKALFIFDETSLTYISIEKANSTIKTIFALCSVIFPCITEECIIFAHDFGILDVSKKLHLLLFYQRIAMESSMCQFFITDTLSDQKYYKQILKDFQMTNTFLNDDDKFLVTNK